MFDLLREKIVDFGPNGRHKAGKYWSHGETNNLDRVLRIVTEFTDASSRKAFHRCRDAQSYSVEFGGGHPPIAVLSSPLHYAISRLQRTGPRVALRSRPFTMRVLNWCFIALNIVICVACLWSRQQNRNVLGEREKLTSPSNWIWVWQLVGVVLVVSLKFNRGT